MGKHNSRQTSRRAFLGTVALAAGAFESACHAGNPVEDGTGAKGGEPTRDFCFTQPFDGGIIHEECAPPVLGTETGPDGTKMLKIQVAGLVPPGAKLEVFTTTGQKTPVKIKNGTFRGTTLLTDRITEIKARATIDGAPREIRTRAVWARNSYRRIRCYIDDHSFFFRDILKEDYKSIFDCLYLAKLRELHRNFGAKINLNCLNTTGLLATNFSSPGPPSATIATPPTSVSNRTLLTELPRLLTLSLSCLLPLLIDDRGMAQLSGGEVAAACAGRLVAERPYSRTESEIGTRPVSNQRLPALSASPMMTTVS